MYLGVSPWIFTRQTHLYCNRLLHAGSWTVASSYAAVAIHLRRLLRRTRYRTSSFRCRLPRLCSRLRRRSQQPSRLPSQGGPAIRKGSVK